MSQATGPVCKGCDICRTALVSDPDPRPVINQRILRGTLRPDWTTQAEVFQWQDRQRQRHPATPGEGGGAK